MNSLHFDNKLIKTSASPLTNVFVGIKVSSNFQLCTCIYINVRWLYIHKISLCQLKKLQIGIPFYNEKNFRPFSMRYVLLLSLSLSLSLSLLISKSFEIIDIFHLTQQKILYYTMSASLLWFLHINHIKTWAYFLFLQGWCFISYYFWNEYIISEW